MTWRDGGRPAGGDRQAQREADDRAREAIRDRDYERDILREHGRDGMLAYQLATTATGGRELAGQPMVALSVVLACRALGLDPYLHAASVQVKQGRTLLRPDHLAAVVRSHGSCVSIEVASSSDDAVEVVGHRLERDDSVTRHAVRYTMADAHRAGLAGDMYQRYPARMLYARALGYLVRTLWPDVCAGVYTDAEVTDDEPATPRQRPTPPPRVEPVHVEADPDGVPPVLAGIVEAHGIDAAHLVLRLATQQGGEMDDARAARALDWLGTEAGQRALARIRPEVTA